MAQTNARISTHPIHPMLVVLPLGLWVVALVFDIVYAVTGNQLWRTVAFWNIGAGIIGALLAAIPGFVDYLDLEGRARRLGTYHMILNLLAVALYAVNFFIRMRVDGESWWPLALSVIGVIGIGISGWLGGEMVYVERVGVKDEARRAEERRRYVA